jgi:uncharacterized phage-associated protein
MQPKFDEVKATQAAVRFLKLNGGSMNYMVLLKLLYLMEREALIRWGRPVTNDKYYSLPKGPVLSSVYSLMVEEPFPWEKGVWAQHISEPSHFIVETMGDPGTSELSQAEEELIAETFGNYGHLKPFELVELLHKILPEWKEPKGGRIPITIADILRAGKRTSGEIKAILSELEEINIIRSVLGSASKEAP